MKPGQSEPYAKTLEDFDRLLDQKTTAFIQELQKNPKLAKEAQLMTEINQSWEAENQRTIKALQDNEEKHHKKIVKIRSKQRLLIRNMLLEHTGWISRFIAKIDLHHLPKLQQTDLCATATQLEKMHHTLKDEKSLSEEQAKHMVAVFLNAFDLLEKSSLHQEIPGFDDMQKTFTTIARALDNPSQEQLLELQEKQSNSTKPSNHSMAGFKDKISQLKTPKTIQPCFSAEASREIARKARILLGDIEEDAALITTPEIRDLKNSLTQLDESKLTQLSEPQIHNLYEQIESACGKLPQNHPGMEPLSELKEHLSSTLSLNQTQEEEDPRQSLNP